MVNEQLAGVRLIAERLFSALRRRDARAAAACYSDDATFSAPVVGDVEGRDIAAFWKAIFAATRNSSLKFVIVDVGLTAAKVEGVAAYTFVSSGRSVISPFSSRLDIKDQLIVRHDDAFDTWHWAQMAYGREGLMFGWSKAWLRRIGDGIVAK